MRERDSAWAVVLMVRADQTGQVWRLGGASALSARRGHISSARADTSSAHFGPAVSLRAIFFLVFGFLVFAKTHGSQVAETDMGCDGGGEEAASATGGAMAGRATARD